MKVCERKKMRRRRASLSRGGNARLDDFDVTITLRYAGSLEAIQPIMLCYAPPLFK